MKKLSIVLALVLLLGSVAFPPEVNAANKNDILSILPSDEEVIGAYDGSMSIAEKEALKLKWAKDFGKKYGKVTFDQAFNLIAKAKGFKVEEIDGNTYLTENGEITAKSKSWTFYADNLGFNLDDDWYNEYVSTSKGGFHASDDGDVTTIGTDDPSVFGKTEEKSGISIYINGTLIETNKEIGQPYIENDRTMVPIRLISEKIGYKVDWNGEKRQVAITDAGSKIYLEVGKNGAIVNGQKAKIDENKSVVPVIKNDRTYVPLRFISENFGASIEYEQPEPGVHIISIDK